MECASRDSSFVVVVLMPDVRVPDVRVDQLEARREAVSHVSARLLSQQPEFIVGGGVKDVGGLGIGAEWGKRHDLH
jgi:hypothetical protein